MKLFRLTRHRRLALAASAFVVTVFGMAWGALSTEFGTRLVWGMVDGFLPETLDVGRVSGRLRTPLSFHSVSVVTPQAEVEIDEVRVRWRLASLVRRRFDVSDIAVDGVRVRLLEPADPEAPSEPLTSLPPFELPLTVELAHAAASGIVVQMPATDAEPVEVDSLVIAGASFRSELVVESVSITLPEGQVTASVRVRTQDVYPFAVEVSWNVIVPQVGAVTGSLEAAGDLDAVDATAELTRPFEARLVAGVSDPLESWRIEARLTVDSVDFQNLSPDGPEGTARGVFELQGVVDSLRLEALASVTMPSTGEIELEAAATRVAERVILEQFEARLDEARVQGGGTVVLSDEGPDMDLDVSWSDVRWPLQGEAQGLGISGALHVEGTADAYSVRGEANLPVGTLPRAHLDVLGSGDAEQFGVEQLRVATLGGVVTMEGHVTWAPELTWDLVVAARDLETAELLPDTSSWQGSLSLDARSRGSLVGELLVVDLDVEGVRGELRQAPLDAVLSASARLPWREDGPAMDEAALVLRQFDAGWGGNRLSASGHVADSVSFDVALSAPALDALSLGVSGVADGRGHVTGVRAEPEIEVDLSARGLGTESFGVGELIVTGSVQASPAGSVEVQATVSNVRGAQQILDSLALRVSGTVDGHDVHASVLAGALQIELLAAGGIAERAWTGSLDDVDIRLDSLAGWRLEAPAPVTVAATAVDVGVTCLRADPARVCFEAGWLAEGAVTTAFSVRELSTRQLPGMLPDGWSVLGSSNADGTVSMAPDGALTAHARADVGPGLVRYPVGDSIRELTYTGAISLHIGDAGAQAAILANLWDEAQREVIAVDGEIRLPDYSSPADTLVQQALAGTLRSHVEDLSLFRAMAPALGPLAGVLDIDVSFAGTVERPEVRGDARLEGGSADVPQLGVEFRDIDLVASGRGADGMTLEGSLSSGGGTLDVGGSIPLSLSADEPLRLQLDGTDFQAVALPEASIWLSPSIEIIASRERIDVVGEIVVPDATIELVEIPTTAVRPSPDVVFVDDTLAGPALPDLGLELRVVLGDSLSFRGFGFSARPTGSVLATDGPAGVIAATGEISLLQGRYRAYGQDLTMENGRIFFSGGPITNPALDIRASRTATDGVVAGLQVDGTLTEPVVTIFSEPSMQESDALAYIVLGRPLSEASEAGGDQIVDAAVALGVRQSNAIATQVGQSLGLSEVRIEAEGNLEEASVAAGKYLTPRLFVSYGIGLFEPVSTFQLRYLLSRNWVLSAKTGTGASSDLMYRVERGR